MVFPSGIDVGVKVGVDGTTVAVDNVTVDVGISTVATVVGLGAQLLRKITAIMREATWNML
jgi:hypothetical protein